MATTWTNIIGVVAGGSATANTMNGVIADVMLAGKPPMAFAYQTAAQTGIVSGTDPFTKVTFGAASPNTGSTAMWSSGANTRITCQVDGYYLVSGTVVWDEPAASNTGARNAVIYKNGSRLTGSYVATQPANATSTITTITTPPVIVQLSTTDYLELGLYHTQGANMKTMVSGGAASSLCVQWVSAS